MAQKLISSAILFAVMCQLSQQMPTSEPIRQSMNETYMECNQKMTLRCFGMPTGCVDKENCVVLLSAKPTQTGADFMMYWNRDPTAQDRWVGAGISADKKMGNDSVTECILKKDNSVTVRQGLTYGGDDYGVKTVEPVRGITAETGSFSDNVLSCSWSRVDDTMVKDLDFNILKEKYYILLAYGPMLNDDLKHHSDAWVSKDAYYLAESMTATTAATTPKPTTQATTSRGTSRQTTGPTTSNPKTTVTNVPTSNSTQTVPVTTSAPSNSTTPSSNSTTASSNSTTPSGVTTQRIQTTTQKGGSAIITFNLSLAIFVTIVFSLNL